MAATSFVRHLRYGALALSALLLASTPSQAALTFNFSFIPGTSSLAQTAFMAAGASWSNLFSDNVTVNLTVGTGKLDTGVLGQAASRELTFAYSTFTSALAADSNSAADAIALSHLPAGNSFGMLINGTTDNPNGVGSSLSYLDNDGGLNNRSITMTAANAKALGLDAGSGNLGGLCTSSCDAFIEFNSDFAFDYDPGNGISSGTYDFTGVAMHEIGHALGFISGVDILDYTDNFGHFAEDAFTFVSPLDMFRYSDASTAAGVIDWTADARRKYFSIDGGATALGDFSTGTFEGDGRQASHWKDNMGLGVMDPTAAAGELLYVSEKDKLAFDVIGWNLAQQAPLPEPASWVMMILGFGLTGAALRRASPAARTSFRFPMAPLPGAA